MDPDDIDAAASGAQDALVADAAAAEAAQGRSRERASGTCRNCGAELQGRHCYACGQVADDYHRPIWTLIADALEGLFSVDGRFWRTVPPLLIRPGRITRNYLTGIRARYMQPFRLFLLASVTFFLAFEISSGGLFDFDSGSPEQRAAAQEELDRAQREIAEAAENVGTPEGAASLEAARRGIEAARDRLDDNLLEQLETDPVLRAAREDAEKREMICALRQALIPEEIGADCQAVLAVAAADGSAPEVEFGGVETWPIGFRRLIARNGERAIDNPDLYVNALKTWAPRMVFVLFPVYGLLLGLMHFWRRRIYIYDHLIVSLHFHSFLFFFLTILMVVGHFIGPALPIVVFLVWSNIYLYRVHRLVYGHGRIMSALRTLTVDFLYSVVLLISLLGLLAVGLIFIT